MHDAGGTTAIDDFNPDNHAWRRFTATAEEHFEVAVWHGEDDRPIMVSLTDLGSGDIVTLAVIDSLEVRDPYTLLAFTADGALTAHGPFEGDHAAAGYAPSLAATDPTVVATGPAALHPPDQPAVPEDAWGPLPAEIAASAHATPAADAPVTVLVLLDRTRAVAAAVGPFDDPAAADAWRPTPDPGPEVDRLVIGVHPIRPAAAG
jgi:hypothetical protein